MPGLPRLIFRLPVEVVLDEIMRVINCVGNANRPLVRVVVDSQTVTLDQRFVNTTI